MLEMLRKLRYRYWPETAIGELLKKDWTETAVPFVLLVSTIIAFTIAVSGFLAFGNVTVVLGQGSELGLVVLGEVLVLVVGGIDLSVGAIYAICNVLVLYLIHVHQIPVVGAIAIALLCGAALGAINGVLVGYLRLRAFITTLVTLLVFRAVFNMIQFQWAVGIASHLSNSNLWNALGTGSFFNIPIETWIFLVICIGFHILLTRMRVGWRIMAVGGSRRSAYNAGLPVKGLVAASYIASGVFAAAAATLYGARIDSSSADAGSGMVIIVLAAALIGGVGIGGGRGSATKAVLGTFIIFIVVSGLSLLATPAGQTRMILAGIFLVATALDVRWFRNRGKAIDETYVSPGYLDLGKAPDVGAGSVYAINDRLNRVDLIGLRRVESPEDVILDEDDNLYCGTRHGDIMRFRAPAYRDMEVYAHVGGQPLGMAFDSEGNLDVCSGGMGLYRVTPDRKVERLTDETNRSMTIRDDSRLRLADDLDIAPDGRIFFSEATTRYEMHEWEIDSLEARGNGRIVCYDPNTKRTRTVVKNLVFPNGICLASDRQSILFAESWACRVSRYWFDGPNKGRVERVIGNLPGYPDNINRASDGNYWLALMGMRGPTFDLAMRKPAFRRKMIKRIPRDEWLSPNINIGCVVKFSDRGEIIESLWERTGQNHPMITSMREHRGYLYLGGIHNNRIGRCKLDGADPDFVQFRFDERLVHA